MDAVKILQCVGGVLDGGFVACFNDSFEVEICGKLPFSSIYTKLEPPKIKKVRYFLSEKNGKQVWLSQELYLMSYLYPDRS